MKPLDKPWKVCLHMHVPLYIVKAYWMRCMLNKVESTYALIVFSENNKEIQQAKFDECSQSVFRQNGYRKVN